MEAVNLGDHTPRPHRIAVLGLGHVGLPTALGLCSLGWDVIGADEDAAKVETIKAGTAPFFEPELEHFLQLHLGTGKFRPTQDVLEAIRSASVIFLCVGTPQREDGAADVSQIEALARAVGKNLNGYKLVVEKSTVPAVTARWVKRTIGRYASKKGENGERTNGDGEIALSSRESSGADFDVASNPEFLREGKAMDDFFRPNRVVLGVDSDRARAILEEIYRPIQCPKVVTDLATAELIKHAANSFLSTKISFINMVADICDSVGADVVKVAEGLGLDPRIAPGFLQAGVGFGGFCFPKDLRAFVRLAEDRGIDCSLLRDVERINHQRVDVFLRKIRSFLWVLQDKPIGVLGLAFKPDTDDIREAPSLKIIDALLKEGADLRLYDPWAMPAVQQLYPPLAGDITYCDSPYEVARGAEALLLLTEWPEFKRLDLERLHGLMETPLLIDGRNFFEPKEMQEAGFTYVGMGRAGGEPFHRETADASPVRPLVRRETALVGGLHG